MKTKTTTANRYAQLERSAIDSALDETLQQGINLAVGWETFITGDIKNRLERFAGTSTSGRVAEIARDTAMRRAKQIAGVLINEALYSLRNEVADQLEREYSTPEGKEIAGVIREFDPDLYWER